MTISPEQCRAARAIVSLSQDELARRAQVARATLADFERGERTPHPRNMAAIREALEAAGVEFTPDGGVRPRAGTCT